MILYKRTAAGNAAATDPLAPMPRKLRTLLIGIDGRTKRSVYIQSLTSFGDVAALLDALIQQGYIEAIETNDPGAASDNTLWETTEVPATERQAAPGAPSTNFDSVLEYAGMTRSTAPHDDVASWDRFQPNPALSHAKFERPAARAGVAAGTAQYQLRSAVCLMSDFVTAQLPHNALEIVLMLEGLTSVEQVIASLKGYEAMVAPAGSAARQHIAELRKLLSSQ